MQNKASPRHQITVWPVQTRWLMLLVAGLATLVGCTTQVPPNVVFILADDLGYMDVGAYNPNTFYETPNIDRLADEGVRFTQAYAAAPVCSPTRASIMTGLYPARLNTTDYFGAPQPSTVNQHWTRHKPLLPAPYLNELPEAESTLAEVLSADGYQTFFAGKWHLGEAPDNHGFDINKGGWSSGGPYGRGGYFAPYDNPRLEEGPEGEHLPDRLASEAVTFMRENRSNPFLVFLSFYSVHTPLMTTPELEAKYTAKEAPSTTWGQEGNRQVRLTQNHAVYAGMVESMDQAIGKVLDALDTLGLADNTIVFFTSDNGGLSTSEGHPTSNLPLRAGKGWLYEGGIREPLIVRWPTEVRTPRVETTPVMSTDFMPTILDMVGHDGDQRSDGVTLWPLVSQERPLPQRNLYWHYPHYGNQGGSPGSAIRQGPWKLIVFYEDDHMELYNIETDLEEKHNRVEQASKQAAELEVALNSWLEDMDAQMPQPNPAADPMDS